MHIRRLERNEIILPASAAAPTAGLNVTCTMVGLVVPACQVQTSHSYRVSFLIVVIRDQLELTSPAGLEVTGLDAVTNDALADTELLAVLQHIKKDVFLLKRTHICFAAMAHDLH